MITVGHLSTSVRETFMETRCPFLDKQRGEDKPIYKITSNKTINVITVKGILVDI